MAVYLAKSVFTYTFDWIRNIAGNAFNRIWSVQPSGEVNEVQSLAQSPMPQCQNAEHKHSQLSGVDHYHHLHKQSLNDPWKFWYPIIYQLHWNKMPSQANFCHQNFDKRRAPVEISWMSDSETNICYNCLDVHIKNGYGDEVAFHWVGNEPNDTLSITYTSLLRQVCQLSNALTDAGAVAGDRIGLYMGMAPEALISMLAIARIGAIHVVVFGGYSSDALAKRLLDTKARFLLCIDGSFRGSKLINIEKSAWEAVKACADWGHSVEKVIVKSHLNRFRLSSGVTTFNATSNSFVIPDQNAENEPCFESSLRIDYDIFVRDCKTAFHPVWRRGNDTLFILHTSGSTGAPKGIEHSHAGYMVYAATTFQFSFDIKIIDSSNLSLTPTVFFCTGDIGWITGHTYNCYGPLLNRATFVAFEGIPLYPDPGRYWQICEQFQVTHFYTAPTAIRACLAHGNEFVQRYDLSNLRILGSVGEAINESAWNWFNDVVGQGKCVIVDTYFQTETGGHVIANLPYLINPKPGCAQLPFFGCEFALLDDNGNEIEGNNRQGDLVMKKCGPGMMKGMYNRPTDFVDIYFSKYPGYYFTGDGALRDSEGFYYITGRIDDKMNCSGHLLSSSEIESQIATHPRVCECSVVSVPHPLKRETPYAFVVLKAQKDSEQEISNSATDQSNLGHGDEIQSEKSKASELDIGSGDCDVSVSEHNVQDMCHDDNDDLEALKQEIQRQVRKKIGAFAIPERVIFCSALPKTRSGKIVRRLIRAISSGNTSYGDLSTLTNPDVIDELVHHFANIM